MLSAKEELQNIGRDSALLECKLEELERVSSLAEKMTAAFGGEAVSGSKNYDPMGSSATKKVTLKHEIMILKKSLDERKAYFSGIIDTLRIPARIKVLYGVYYHGKTKAALAREMNYSYRNICNIHDAAVAEVEEKMGAAESLHIIS